MTERALPVEGLDLRRLCPWVQLFRSFRLALRVRQLILAAVGILLATAGTRAIEHSLGGPRTPAELSAEHPWPYEMDLGFRIRENADGDLIARESKSVAITWFPSVTIVAPEPDPPPPPIDAVAALSDGLSDPVPFLEMVLTNLQVALLPVRDIVSSTHTLFSPESDLKAIGRALLQIAWWLIVWSLIGGAISRSAAVEFARDQSTHLWGGVNFVIRRYVSYLAAPLLPLAGLLVLGGLCTLGGLLGRFGGEGGLLLIGLIWGLLLLLGVVLAIVVMGLACGWPLMFATISVEGSDGFDGLSRAYNYVYERPLYYLWQVAITLIYASFAAFCVLFMVQLGLRLAVCGTAWGAGKTVVRTLVLQTPPLLAGSPIDFELAYPNESSQTEGEETTAESDDATDEELKQTWGAHVIGFWMNLLATLVVGFVYSFFWSNATVIYFLLRRSVDGNDFDEVFLGDSAEHDNLLPLVGAAAMGADLSAIGSVPPAADLPPDNPPYPRPQ